MVAVQCTHYFQLKKKAEKKNCEMLKSIDMSCQVEALCTLWFSNVLLYAAMHNENFQSTLLNSIYADKDDLISCKMEEKKKYTIAISPQ